MKTKEAMDKCIYCGKSIVEHEVSGYYSDVFYCYTGRAGSPIQRFTRASSWSNASPQEVAIRAVQVRAIRWIAAHWRETYALNQHAREWSVELDKVADRIERGELTVPTGES